MFMSIGLWAQEAVSTHVIVWDMYMQVLYVGRALRTKEALLDFLKVVSGNPTSTCLLRADG